MSMASVYPRSHNLLNACQDFNHETAFLSIEEIRHQLYSCFSCGVSWLQDHVCLDCAECGGYSLQRPCPSCDGRCSSAWKRDLNLSHASGTAQWSGMCRLQNLDSPLSTRFNNEKKEPN